MVVLYFAVAFLIMVAYYTFGRKKLEPSSPEVYPDFSDFLEEKVLFFKKLKPAERIRFEKKMIYFLQRVEVTGVETEITFEDKLLVASAATIPIFYFDDWFYSNIYQVLIYPSGFNKNFEIGDEHPIQGMVGNRFMHGKMLLSLRALRGGFHNKTDKNNTAVHEFVHLIDMEDGVVDGIPEVFMTEQNVLPWVDLMYQKIREIKNGDSDIKPYGATNEAEFLSVVAEYFFERPLLLKKKHPELYRILDESFRQKIGNSAL